MSGAVPSAPDPMQFLFATYRETILSSGRPGKVLRDPRLVPGEKTAVFITAGQSLAAGTNEGSYTPVNAAKCDHLNVFDGAVYNAVDPLLGHGLATNPLQRQSTWPRVADQLITAGVFQRVILIPVAYGGTTVANWDVGDPGLFPLHELILIAGRRARAVGLPITGIIWQQGESDSSATPRKAYRDRFLSMHRKVWQEIDAPWFVGRSTYTPGGSISQEVRSACLDVVDNHRIYRGADTDGLGAAFRYDDQHWNAAGAAQAAALWFAALDAVF